MSKDRLTELVERARRDVSERELEALRRALEPELGALPTPAAAPAPPSIGWPAVLGAKVVIGVGIGIGIALALLWAVAGRVGDDGHAGVSVGVGDPHGREGADVGDRVRVDVGDRDRVVGTDDSDGQSASDDGNVVALGSGIETGVDEGQGGAEIGARPGAESGGSRLARRARAAQRNDVQTELALIERARRELVIDPRAAIETLDEHRRTFARGALSEERELLAIEALARLGRWDVADRRRARFVVRYPRSVHGRRLEELFRGRVDGAR